MNESLIKLCLGGGLFAILVFIHLFVDFVCQTHFEAMNKHNNPSIRARHCFIYGAGFVPILIYLCSLGALSKLEYFASLAILFLSHFAEDSYVPVVLWAKYIRRPPEMINASSDKEGFIQFVSAPLGKILMIAIDQIIHFAFLFPIVWMALNWYEV